MHFIFRCLPIWISDSAEKKTCLLRAPLFVRLPDLQIFLYFQNFLVPLELYFGEEFMPPLLSGHLVVVGLLVSFYLPHPFFGIFTRFFILALFGIRSINRGKWLTDEPQTSQNRSQHGSLPRFIERIPSDSFWFFRRSLNTSHSFSRTCCCQFCRRICSDGAEHSKATKPRTKC